MRWLVACILVAALTLVGCPSRPSATEQAARRPTFAAKTWDGEEHVGPLAWDERGPAIGGHRLASGQVRIIARRTAAAVRAAASVEGFEPLSPQKLQEYRQRAEAAARKYPGLDSVLCLDYGQNTLTKDGKHIWRYHALVLVLKEKGRKAADLQLAFTEGRSRRRVLFARSIAPDGTSRWLDPSTLKVSTPPRGRLHLDTTTRVLSGRIPGAEIGSLVEFAYEHEEYSPDLPSYFFPTYFFRGDVPFLDSVIDVRVPEGRKLNWTTRHMPERARRPQRRSEGGYDVYRWEMHDSPPLIPEPMMPHHGDVLPRLECSLFFDWEEIFTRTGGYQRERIELTPEIRALARRIVGNAQGDDEKLAAIYHWVQRHINYMSIKASRSSGWAGHPASQTIRNGYGDCTDVAIVFASLARAVGIRAYPVIVRTNDSGTAVTDIPIPDANHCISLAFPGGRPRFLDCTATNYRYPYFRDDDHGATAIVHITKQILTVPVPPPEDNLRVSHQELTLAADGGATMVERNAYTGTYEARIRSFYRYVPPALHQRIMEQYLQRRCPGAACTGLKLSDLENLTEQVKMEIHYRVAKLATLTRDLYVVSPPGFARHFPEASLPQRRFAIERPTTEGYRNTIQVACPPGYELVGVPGPLTLEAKHLSFEGRVEPAKDGKTLTIHETFKYRTRQVPAADYRTYRDHATRIAAWTRLKLVFRKRAQAR